MIHRAKKVNKLDSNMIKVTGPSVNFEGLPYYLGLKQFIFIFPKAA